MLRVLLCEVNEVERLYTEKRGAVFSWLRKRVATDEDAEDLTQNAFLKLSIAEIDPTNNPESYLWLTARNLLKNWYRDRDAEKRAELNTRQLREGEENRPFSNRDKELAWPSEFSGNDRTTAEWLAGDDHYDQE